MIPRLMTTRRRARLLLQGLESRTVPATFAVTNVGDSGTGSLRQAITDSNAAIGADSIVFEGALWASAQTITLQSALPNITDDLTITGTGAKILTVTRDGSAGNFRIFTVKNLGATLTVGMSGLKITNGYCDATSQTDNGGGIYVGANHTLTLDSVEISGNTSTAQGGGIAMDQRGRLTITNSTISGNVALGTEYGSPLEAFSGVGGGIYFTLDGNLTLLNSTVDNNSAKNSGGGIFLYGESSGTALIRNSTISSNKVTASFSGVLYKSGGGGIAVLNNSFAGGTGLFALTLQNSTVTANTAAGSSQGGGLQLSGLQANKITARIESTVVASNLAGSGVDIFGGAGGTVQKVTVDYSAIGSTTGFTLTPGPGTAASNQINLTFPLGSLTFNPLTATTRTHLPSGTLLIDKGSNPGATATDQRLLSRYYDDPGVAGALTVDIGAAEVQPAGLPTATATAPTVTVAGGTTETITVTYKDDSGITLATIGNGDILVTGPSGYSKTGTFVSLTGSGTLVVATYTVPATGGAWSSTADGAYTISVVAGQVTDASSNAVPAGAIGTFQVAIPRTIVVTTANDSISTTDGKTSLREAITLANDSFPSNDSITFDANVFLGGDFITWALGQMFITDSVTIIGTGQTKLTFDGASSSRHFNLDGPGILNVTITGVTISAGRTTQELQSERGGSIYNNGENLTLDNVWMFSNTAQKSYGGAIHIQGQGSVTFKNGRLNNNTSPNYAGGAISALDAGHTISISNSRITGNVGGYYGGAVFSSGGGTVTVDRCTVSNNSTTLVIGDDQSGTILTGGGGGFFVANGKVINGSVLEDYPSISTLTVQDSLFDGNTTAVAGGAVLFNGNTTGVLFRNSTFVNNKTGSSQNNVGGALLVGNLQSNPVLIDNCTFAFNSAYSGGGLFVENDNVTSVKANSTIFAMNSSADPSQLPPDVDGSLTANNCFFGVVEGVGLDIGSANNVGNGGLATPADPMLDFLQDNGGPTFTIALLPTSPCLDVGLNPLSLSFDQRGAGYARVSKGVADIGAYELQVASPPTVTSITIDDGTVQRSLVRSITVTFDSLVTLGVGTPANAFQLVRSGPGAPMSAVTITVVDQSTATQTISKLTFSGSLSSFASLIDGNYTLTIPMGTVVNAGSQTLAADSVTDLHRLFGDADGDKDVDNSDFVAFRMAFGTGPSIFNADGDGDTDNADFVAFRGRFGSTLP